MGAQSHLSCYITLEKTARLARQKILRISICGPRLLEIEKRNQKGEWKDILGKEDDVRHYGELRVNPSQ